MSAGPDLPRVAAAFNDDGARYVVIGGFAVIAHQYVRATEDVDPDPGRRGQRRTRPLRARAARARMRDGGAVTPAALAEREHLRVDSDAGIVDLLRAGAPPLDFESVDAASIEATVDGVRDPRLWAGQPGRLQAPRRPLTRSARPRGAA